MKKICSCILTLSIIVGLLTGCGSNAKTTNTGPNAYIDSLEEGYFYIRSKKDNNCQKPLWSSATFDRKTSSYGNNSRVIWFTEENLNKIPTFYEGDSIIYKNKETLLTDFTFERFEDFGYSVGLALLGISSTGRPLIKIGTDSKNICSGSDADQIIQGIENSSAFIDTLGKIPLRGTYDEANNLWSAENICTRCGSLKNLVKDQKYEIELYSGTYRYEYVLTANRRVFGSMEGITTHDYNYESDYLINIPLPKDLKTGYYMLNGTGLFRYIANADLEKYPIDTDYDKYIEFYNVPNGWIEKDQGTFINSPDPTDPSTPTPVDKNERKFETYIEELYENTNIFVKIENCINPQLIAGIVRTPLGEEYSLISNPYNGTLSLDFTPPITGTYTIILWYLKDEQVSITVTNE